MAFTFGGHIGSKVSWNNGTAFGGNADSTLVMGWYRPTTLTAGRTLWTINTNHRCQVDTTTDELRWRSGHSTTQGEWTTTGVDMAVNNWYFLAWLSQWRTTPSTQYPHLWRGTTTGRPVKISLTEAVAPSGAPQTSAICTVGNRDTNDQAWQGQIEDQYFLGDTTGSGGPLSVFNLASALAISDADADWVFRRYVQPYWQGATMTSRIKSGTTIPLREWTCSFTGTSPRLQRRNHQTFVEDVPLVEISGQTGQFIRPDSFISATNWTGAVTAIDETVADDADFVYSANNTATTLDIGMSNPASAGGAMPTVRFRHARTNAGVVDGAGNAALVTADLYDGTTVLATDAQQTPTGTWTTRTWTPTVAAGVNWDNVRVRLAVTASGGSPANRRGCGISWVEIEWVAEESPTYEPTVSHPRRPRYSRRYPLLVR